MQRAQAIMTILSLANLDYPDGQYLKKYDENIESHLIPKKNINASGVFRDISGRRIQWVEGWLWKEYWEGRRSTPKSTAWKQHAQKVGLQYKGGKAFHSIQFLLQMVLQTRAFFALEWTTGRHPFSYITFKPMRGVVVQFLSEPYLKTPQDSPLPPFVKNKNQSPASPPPTY